MRFVIVTGMSGAGKSASLKMLEDAGYFCIDNLPIQLMPKLITSLYGPASDPEPENVDIALGLDIRSGEYLNELEHIFADMDRQHIKYEILFLECGNDVLVKRFKESRRNHPLAGAGRMDAGIQAEREKLDFLKRRADYIIDTTRMLTRELKVELYRIFVENKAFENLHITVLSFGFKYGVPHDADLMFDVRFLPNPYYIEELKGQTGNDEAVRSYVMGQDAATEFLWKLMDMLQFLLPHYITEGKNRLVIAIGCTGGKHRSVTLANELNELLSQEENYGLSLEHRDINKDARRDA